MNLFELYLKYSFQLSSWSIQLPQVYGLICLKCRIFFFYSNLQKKSSVTATQALRSEIPAAPQGFFMRNKKNCSDCSSCFKKKSCIINLWIGLEICAFKKNKHWYQPQINYQCCDSLTHPWRTYGGFATVMLHIDLWRPAVKPQAVGISVFWCDERGVDLTEKPRDAARRLVSHRAGPP